MIPRSSVARFHQARFAGRSILDGTSGVPSLPPSVAPYRPFVLAAWRYSGLGLWALLAAAMMIEYGRGLHRNDILSMRPTDMMLGRFTFKIVILHPTVEIPKPGTLKVAD
jgi:hypothetical protein